MNSLEYDTIKKCFVLFIDCLEKNSIKDLPTANQIKEYDVRTIKYKSHALFMQYILSQHSYIVIKDLPVTYAYQHLMNIINEYNGEHDKIIPITTDWNVLKK